MVTIIEMRLWFTTYLFRQILGKMIGHPIWPNSENSVSLISFESALRPFKP